MPCRSLFDAYSTTLNLTVNIDLSCRRAKFVMAREGRVYFVLMQVEVLATPRAGFENCTGWI
jgi:hypothetical protein